MKKIAIVNTKCHKLKKSSFSEYLIAGLKQYTDGNVAFTEYPGHAEKIAKDAEKYDIIIAVGGDGTIFEIVNGMDLERQAIAIVPIGTGNSLARELGITGIKKAFEVIKNNKTAKIDLMHLRFGNNSEKFEKYGTATSGLGFAAGTVTLANHCLKKAGGFCYPLSACLKSLGQEVIAASIRIDDRPSQDIQFTNFFINNAGYAGNTRVFPDARLEDSAFNISFFKTNALTQYLWNIGIITKTYFYYPEAKTARRLHILLRKPSPFMLDGEIFDSVQEILCSIMPQKLTIFK